MQIHQIKPKTKNKTSRRVGRGGKRGTYSGKGMKGQKSRAGRKMRPQLRDTIKKLPKKRGYRFKVIGEKALVVNLDILEKKFNNGDIVTPAILAEKGIIKERKGKIPAVKILGTGEILKKLSVSNCLFSESAAEKIKKAGGEIK